MFLNNNSFSGVTKHTSLGLGISDSSIQTNDSLGINVKTESTKDSVFTYRVHVLFSTFFSRFKFPLFNHFLIPLDPLYYDLFVFFEIVW